MPIRERTRDESYYASLLYTWDGNPGVENVGPMARQIQINGVYETIRDLAGKSSPLEPRVVKPVLHTKLRYVGIPYQDWYGDNNLGVYMLPGVGAPFRPDILLGMLPVVSEGLVSNLVEEAFNTFSTQFPETFSVAEFAQGMSELDSLIPKFSGKLVNDLASLKLGNDFGWQSLLSDINVFTSLVGNIESRLKWLRDTHGKPTKLAFSRRNIAPDWFVNDVYDNLARGWRVRYRLREHQSVFRAGATLTQSLEHLNDAIGYLRALSGASGFSNPLKSFWNLVPFSFIVDYFLPISRRLDSFKVQAAEPWNLSMMSHSISTTATWEIYQDNPDVVNGTYHEDFLGFVTGSVYDRRVGLPVRLENYLTPSAPLSAGQLTLLGALLAANS